MGNVRLIKGDCVEILKNMKPKSVDLVVSDPPYKLEMPKKSGVDNLLKAKKMNRVDEEWDKYTLDEYIKWSEEWIIECFRVLKPHGSMFIFGSYHNIGLINYIMQKNKFMIINDICWFKRNAVPNLACRRLTASYESILWTAQDKKYIFNYDDLKNGNFPNDKIKSQNKQMRNVWDIPTAGNEKYEISIGSEKINHPTQKPTEVIKRCIMTGINKSEKSIILDPFGGSGTTGVVASDLGYDSILIERDDNFFELMKSRISSNKSTKKVTFD
jgi:DNA modification methylase